MLSLGGGGEVKKKYIIFHNYYIHNLDQRAEKSVHGEGTDVRGSPLSASPAQGEKARAMT